MGIPGLERELRESEGCVIDVSIRDLVENDGKHVIVVDGFQFYGLYLYPKFDWVCGAITDLVREIGKFVHAFERIGVKLVFFFVEGHLDEGSDSCGSRSWVERRSTFIEYTKRIFSQLSGSNNALSYIKRDRKYYHTPLHVQSVVLFALQHIFGCEVHLVYAGDRCDATAYYTKNEKCLALLAQDNYYVFYQCVPRYLSLTDLKLESMTTTQYCRDVFAINKGLEGHLYPTFIESERELKPAQMKMLVKICQKLNECKDAKIARKKIMECLKGKNIEDVIDLEGKDIEKRLNLRTGSFLIELLRYNFEFDYLTVHGPLKKWELIKLRAQELYQSGQMSVRIQQILMSRSYYNDCILEDFIELPPSSLIYRNLRQNLYGILFHEAVDVTDIETKISETLVQEENRDISDSEDENLQPGALGVWQMKQLDSVEPEPHFDNKIDEWVMSRGGCFKDVNTVTPHLVDLNLHPGLLVLWDPDKNTSDIHNLKWQLFSKCVSSGLDCELIRKLLPTLVVPTAVLYYLYHEVPKVFKKGSILQPWEVEVFIAQAVMRSKRDAEIPEINIHKINSRVVKLNAMFVYGCHTMRLLVEACGYPVSEHDLSMWHFFDGKLLHSFYEKAEWRRSAVHLCTRDVLATFQQMKQIILPESSASSRRM